MMTKAVSGLFIVCCLFSCVVIRASRINKRQATESPLPVTGTQKPESQTTENFDDLLDEMFKELGIDSEATGNDSVPGTTVAFDELSTSTSSPSNSGKNVTTPVASFSDGTIRTSIVYPSEGNLTTPPLHDLSALTTATTPMDTDSDTILPSTTPPSETGGVSLDDQQCRVNPILTDFCILPQDLLDFLGPSATLHDLSDFVLSMDVIRKLIENCPPGSWCLNSYHVFNHLQEKIAFWSNSSDFMNLCWQPLDGCLRSVADYYTGCEVYPMYDFIAETKKLLCEMKEEPKASRDCIEQTLKALHVSMADYHRGESNDQQNQEACETKNALMTSNYLCATDVCGDYSDLLFQFKPWVWFIDDVVPLKELCVYDQDRCTTRKEEEAAEKEEEKEEQTTGETVTEEEGILSGNTGTETTVTATVSYTDTEGMADDKNAYSMWVTEEIDVSTVMIIGAITVAALGFFFLVALVVCLRKRKSRYRTREGVEYMEILPDMDD